MVYWYESLLLYIVSFLVPAQGVDPSCECVTFQSYGLSEGQFHSPNYPKPYRPGINCILYTFIGDVNEIVEIKFVDMDLKSPTYIRPNEMECRDRLRVFKNLDRPVVNEDVKHQDELCGSLANLETKNFYSSGRALILEFSTDPDSRESHSGFRGFFTFIEKSSFEIDGQLHRGTMCSYDMRRNNHTRGKFFSPRYPQKYPKLANCEYKFMGDENEHVKVLFKLIRLPKHSSRFGCDESGDLIRVYDGMDKSSKLLESFCDNTHNQVEIFSTGPYMYIEFHSDRHHEEQGFTAEYEFLDKRWVDGSSPVPSDTGIKDTYNGVLKCNQSISSKDKKNGTISSPYHPNSYPSGIICQFDFFAEGQERIQLRFTDMNLYLSAGDPDDPFGCLSQDSITVFVYVDNKEEELGHYCGKKHPQQLMSNGQRMKVLFKSESSQKENNSGFRIEYSFRTDFGVKGNGVQDNREVCLFEYHSWKASNGTFTSPNFPGLYPNNIHCEYIFRGVKKEIVVIDFEEFDLWNGCDDPTDSDSVSFSNFMNTEDRKMPRYCGNRPSYDQVKSDAAFFRVTFKSNEKYDANGFKGLYHFKRIEEPAYSTDVPSVTERREVKSGSRSQVDVSFAIATIILLCKSVIDHLLNVF